MRLTFVQPKTTVISCFRSRLAGNWGIVDVQDRQDPPNILAAAPHSLTDGTRRVAIQGESTGGFTILASVLVAPDPGFFKATTLSWSRPYNSRTDTTS